MTRAKEYGSRCVADFMAMMEGVDRVGKTIDYAKENPVKVAEIYYGYYSIIRDLVNLNKEDLEIIERVNKTLDKKNYVSKFKEITTGKEDNFIELTAQACDPESLTYKTGLIRLSEMMKGADVIKKENPEAIPNDKDPKWDNVIWGYTKGATELITDIHFCVSHGLSQILSAKFPDEMEKLGGPSKKDWLLNAITDVIILKGLQNQGWEGEFYQQWKNKRPDGLGWISEGREKAYKDEIAKKK